MDDYSTDTTTSDSGTTYGGDSGSTTTGSWSSHDDAPSSSSTTIEHQHHEWSSAPSLAHAGYYHGRGDIDDDDDDDGWEASLPSTYPIEASAATLAEPSVYVPLPPGVKPFDDDAEPVRASDGGGNPLQYSSSLTNSVRMMTTDLDDGMLLAERKLRGSVLTQSQEARLQVYVGGFSDLQSKLQLMISTYIDNPRVLRHLLALHDRISATIDVYNQQYGLALAPTTTPTESESAGSSDDDGGSSDDVEGRELPRAPISTELEQSLGDVVAAVGDLRASAPARYRDFLTVSQLAELAGSLDGYEWESDASAPSGDASTSSATAGADADAGADAGTDAGAGVSSTSTDLVAECLICDEEEAGRQLQGCGHFYCNDCLRGWLESKVKFGEVVSIPCPNPSCEVEISEHDMQALLPEETFQKYQQFSFLARLRVEPNCRWCPKPGCETAIIASNDSNTVVCTKCAHSFCKQCAGDSHEGSSCKQAARAARSNEKASVRRQRRQEEAETKRYMKRNKYIRCGSCGNAVQKESGCNHMKCSCGYEFCWLCGERIVNPLGSTYPMHYTIGACAGLQMSSRESLSIHRKVLQKSLAPVKYGLMATAVGAGVVALGIAVPVVTVGAVGAAGVVVTAAAVGLPVYGGYRVAKYTRERRAAKLREAERREREAAEARRTFWLQEAEDAPEWECTACTFLNPPRTGACDVCTTARPTPVES